MKIMKQYSHMYTYFARKNDSKSLKNTETYPISTFLSKFKNYLFIFMIQKNSLTPLMNRTQRDKTLCIHA